MERTGLMLVEDDVFILEDLSTIVDWASEGYDLTTATNGRQGLNKYELMKPSIIITDVRMPFMDGLEMMNEIKLKNPFAEFLVLSAFDDFSYVQEALRSGARDYILKQDITAEALLGKVRYIHAELLKQREIVLNAVKNRLFELIERPQAENAQEELTEILRLCNCFPEDIILKPAQSFAVGLMQKKENVVFDINDDEDLARAFFDMLKKYVRMDGKNQALQYAGVQRYSAPVAVAIDYIKREYRNINLSAGLISYAAGMSYGRLSVLFKNETGKTLSDYITDIRIENAKRLLLTTDEKVYEIAEKVGYGSSQYFSYVFNLKTGQSPVDYRRGGKSS
ncbi:MAG: response regulator [Oscillospiraceae bacterium]|jgi:two-component system response regulator YesN